PVGAARPARSRSSVVFPEPFGPVTSAKPPRGTSRSSPSSTRFSPNCLDSERARITSATLDAARRARQARLARLGPSSGAPACGAERRSLTAAPADSRPIRTPPKSAERARGPTRAPPSVRTLGVDGTPRPPHGHDNSGREQQRENAAADTAADLRPVGAIRRRRRGRRPDTRIVGLVKGILRLVVLHLGRRQDPRLQ